MNHPWSSKFSTRDHEISKYVRIPSDHFHLMADLQVPECATGLVILAYEFGRSRNHPRACEVAAVMREHGMGTLLADLLTEDEEAEDEISGAYRDNAGLLAERVISVTKWAAGNPETKKMKLGYFGAATGGAAVLIAAAKMGKKISAVVSRGGKAKSLGHHLTAIHSPTLLIVGENDLDGMKVSREAFSVLRCEKEIVVVPGASEFFGEPGKLMEMAQRSAEWLRSHCGE